MLTLDSWPALLRKRDFDADGKLTDPSTLLKECGFEIGQFVRRKKDKVLCKIHEVQGEQVLLSIEDGPLTGMAHVATTSFLKGEWKMVQAPSEAEMVDFLQATAESSSEARFQIMRGEIQKKLIALEGQHAGTAYKLIQINTKPQRNVTCTKVIKKGKLQLVPTSLNISFKNPDQGSELNPAGASISLGQIEDGFSAWLQSTFVLPKEEREGFISPFWLIRTTAKLSDANMELSHVFEASDENHTLKIPVLKNSRDLSEGEVLMRFVERRAFEPEPLVPVSGDPGDAPKRRKVGKQT